MNHEHASGVRAQLSLLRAGTTACPGKVARRLGTTLRELRPTLAELAARGEVVVTQGGHRVDLAVARGPIRIAPGAGSSG